MKVPNAYQPNVKPNQFAFDLFEAVGIGHCDKVADRIADTALDFLIGLDKDVRTGIEITVSAESVEIRGEVSTSLSEKRLKSAVIEASLSVLTNSGYPSLPHNVLLHRQSEEIIRGSRDGAGDQAVCVGYATCRTPEMLLPSHVRARCIRDELCRFAVDEESIGQDGKIVVWRELDKYLAVIRWQIFKPGIGLEDEIKKIAQRNEVNVLSVNGAVPFTNAALVADTGVSGRKLAMDFYGPAVPLGGGALSGKDSSKPDRTGNFIARQYACQLAQEVNGEATVWLVFSTGVDVPLLASFHRRGEDGTLEVGQLSIDDISLAGYAMKYGLKGDVVFHSLASHGHFGRGLAWESAVVRDLTCIGSAKDSQANLKI